MRIALLSNVTVEVLAGMLKKRHAVWTPPGFGAWMETALDPPDGLSAFAPDAVFLLLDSSRARFSDADARTAKAALESRFPSAIVFFPDLGDLADEAGGFNDDRMWEVASMPWSMRGLRAIAAEIERLLAATTSPRRKVLALDFDGTLWSGAIGEDGPDAIGPFADFQRGVKSLLERGVLLVGLSKNNAADVEPAWSDPRMVLKRGDFAALRIDWNDKPANLASVAAELNVGADAFVFIDDNPAECARMAAERPEVAVPDFPADAADLPRFIRRVSRIYFPEMRLTDEDLRRTAQYREEAERRAFASGLTADDYLKGLEIKVDVHPVRESEHQRVAQLSQKSNQFNVATNRLTASDVVALASDPSRVFMTAHSRDRFGDQGLIAFVVAVVEGDSATVTDFVMSCRAMNRRIEFTVEERLEAALAERGVRRVYAAWRATAKNKPVENLFDAFGFDLLSSSPTQKRYSKLLHSPSCHRITLRLCVEKAPPQNIQTSKHPNLCTCPIASSSPAPPAE